MPSNDDRLRQLIETCNMVTQVIPKKNIDQGTVTAFNSTCVTVNELAYNIFTKKLGWSDKRLGVLATLESQVLSYSTAIMNAPAIVITPPPTPTQVTQPIANRIITPLKPVTITQTQIDTRNAAIAAKLATQPTPTTTTAPGGGGMYEYTGSEDETPNSADVTTEPSTQAVPTTALAVQEKSAVSLEKIPKQDLFTKYKTQIFIASIGGLLYAMYKFLNRPEPKLSDVEDDE